MDGGGIVTGIRLSGEIADGTPGVNSKLFSSNPNTCFNAIKTPSKLTARELMFTPGTVVWRQSSWAPYWSDTTRNCEPLGAVRISGLLTSAPSAVHAKLPLTPCNPLAACLSTHLMTQPSL